MTREAGGQSRASGDVTISRAEGVGTINAIALINGKAASMGEGTMMGVLTQLVKGFSAISGTRTPTPRVLARRPHDFAAVRGLVRRIRVASVVHLDGEPLPGSCELCDVAKHA